MVSPVRAPDQIVKQRVARPDIARLQRSVGANSGDIGDAADIDHCDITRQAGATDQRLMENRNQRRPLTAGRHIGGAHVEHHRYCEPLSQDPTVADLNRHAPLGRVQDRLSVKADEVDRQAWMFVEQALNDTAMGIGDHRLSLSDH